MGATKWTKLTHGSHQVSLVVILFEVCSRVIHINCYLSHLVDQLTGALSHVLPIMICVMTSKWVGDAIGTDGIYSVWIAMRGYPWLPPVDYHDRGETGADIMKSFEELVVIENESCTLRELGDCHCQSIILYLGD